MKFYKDCNLWDGEPCTGCRDYATLEAQISEENEALLRQRTQILTRINQAHDILTTHVPLEIVHYIFLFCVPDKSSFYDTDNESFLVDQEHWMVSAPLLLGKICTSWRDIAWATGQLWTVYRLHLDDLESSDNVVLTKEWLDRAGQLPLSIRISSFGQLSNECKHRVNECIALINEKSNHWQNLDILGPSLFISRLNGGPGGASNLKTIRIHSNDSNHLEHKFSLDRIPRPSRLCLDYFRLDHVRIDLTNLTHVCVVELDLHQAMDLVQCAVHLVYCKFDTFTNKNDTPLSLPNKPILRQKLESLELASTIYALSRAPENIAFFKSFIFPNLKHLKIQSGGSRSAQENQPSWEPVLSHIINSCLPLVSLCIRHPGRHAITGIVLPILHHTPSLRQFEMTAPCEEDWEEAQNGFFKLLQPTSDTERRFLPNLETLKFHDADENDAVMLCTVISEIVGPISDIQNPHRRPLKTFVVRGRIDADFSYANIESKDLVLQLMKLREEGIVLDIKEEDRGLDLLEHSMELHGLSTPEYPKEY